MGMGRRRNCSTDCTARIEVIRKSAELRERDRQPVIRRAARRPYGRSKRAIEANGTKRNGTDMRRNENF